MRRLLSALAVTALALLGVWSAPAHSAQAGVDDFEFASFHADYHLGTNAEGRATLRVVETIVAVFPDFDQNRGILRTIPDRYNGLPTHPTVLSVTDEAGSPVEYEEEDADGGIQLALGGDDYVRGEQTYVIEYTMVNAHRYYADTDSDEFYWDVNGLEWPQPFGAVSATLHLEPGLEEKLTGNVTAVWGAEDETNPAEIDGLNFEARDLGPYENLTIAVGFEPDTFTERPSGFFDAPWPTLSFVGAGGTLVALLWAFAVRRTRLADAPGRGIIVPEYGPPPGETLVTSAFVSGAGAKVTPAQIIALAVSRRIRVIEAGMSPVLKKPKYRLQFVTADGVDEHEREFLHALFGKTLTPGEHRDLDKQDEKATKKLAKFYERVGKQLIEEGYRRKYPGKVVAPVLIFSGGAMVSGIIFAAVALDLAYGGAWPGVALALSLIGGVVAFMPLIKTPLDARGVAVRDHMKGLKDYIELAEADRLRYLQSPQGALREPIPTDDTAQVVKLNEKLLPYAMLFGHEKEWAEELGRYYQEQGTVPDWYVGSGPFNAALFASSIGSVSTSATSSFSSSSGGSAGGAVSGGGGGGGGGGGR